MIEKSSTVEAEERPIVLIRSHDGKRVYILRTIFERQLIPK